jgi:hypothetical protein
MDERLRDFGTVRHRDGRERLVLLYEQLGDGFNFHSLIWEVRSEGRWVAHRTITEPDFLAGRSSRRWVSKVHGFGREPGTAVIQVGELPRPDGGSVTYSWRLWHLERNEELKLLHICVEPFEPWLGASFES